MDEIDAALDFRNVSIVVNYIKERTKNAQFIIISLRNDMFELSHRLIGIWGSSEWVGRGECECGGQYIIFVVRS
jgi:chromosome segregation ATPase